MWSAMIILLKRDKIIHYATFTEDHEIQYLTFTKRPIGEWGHGYMI
jgi:hypothetical protein